MVSEKKDSGEVLKEQNVLLRIRSLRSVSAALESIEKTYVHTKQSHPVINSVCGIYEKGVSKAGSLAIWSLQPALYVLEPQLVAANSLACKGLDHLEEKVPALQYPPEELTASIKELVTTTLETAKDSVAFPIKQTSNVVLDKVSTGYQQSKNALSDGIHYVLSSKLVYLAEQRADRALSLLENLVDFVLPVSSTEKGDDGSVGEQGPDVGTSGPKPSFSRLGELSGTIYRRAFEKTAAQLQRSKRQGQELVTQIPGVSPLVKYTLRTVKTIGSVILGLPSSVAVFLKDAQQHDTLKVMTSNEFEQLEIPRRSSEPEGGSQMAEDGGSKECECVSSSQVLDTSVEDHMHSPAGNSQNQPPKVTELQEISEEARQLKKKVMEQIPMQQKVILGASNKKVSKRESVTDCTQISSSSSSYISTGENSRSASPTTE
ncbi:perilipin-1 isoform X3 [Carassius gibelio]|uniref:perilipin-1 isoform X3 n=1 Tax=Carassius gibelio TaxID=101364 RepID=UPI0022799FAF|nr:perilipin-1 isoform X3 [Carassius gibelio]